MVMRLDANTFLCRGKLGPLDGADGRGGGCDGRVAGRAGLVLGQGPVGGPEPQRQRQRFALLADLRAGVDVEQLDRLQQLTGAGADGLHHSLGGHCLVDDEADVLEHRGERRHLRRGQRLGDRDGREVQLGGAGAFGQAGPLDDGRM